MLRDGSRAIFRIWHTLAGLDLYRTDPVLIQILHHTAQAVNRIYFDDLDRDVSVPRGEVEASAYIAAAT